MSDDAKKKTSVGGRYILKSQCKKCDGKGYVLSARKMKCSSCSGVGWVINEQGGEIVCSKCNGFRTIVREIKRSCAGCGGKGSVVHLMQDFQGWVTCSECNGSGRYKCECCDGKHLYPCFECDGTGKGDLEVWSDECSCCSGSGRSYPPRPEYFTPYQWKQNPISNEVEKQYGKKWYHDMEINETLILNENIMIEVKLCQSCKSRKAPIKKCEDCGGSGFLYASIMMKGKCLKCNGYGMLSKKLICKECLDKKVVECQFCSEDGFVQCEICAGSGKVIGIISNEV